MQNRRGHFFAFVLIPIVLLMCGSVWYLYYIQSQKLSVSLVSPFEVLKSEDALSLFEMKEVEIINSSLSSANGAFGSDKFLNSFRSNFISNFLNDQEMMDFVSNDSFIKGNKITTKDRNLIEDGIYPKIKTNYVDGKLIFSRSEIEKKKLLLAKERSYVDFPVDFSFKFNKTYLISYVNGDFRIEAKN